MKILVMGLPGSGKTYLTELLVPLLCAAWYVEAKKNERANAFKEVKRLCKEFGFTAGMLKGSLAERRKKQ